LIHKRVWHTRVPRGCSARRKHVHCLRGAGVQACIPLQGPFRGGLDARSFTTRSSTSPTASTRSSPYAGQRRSLVTQQSRNLETKLYTTIISGSAPPARVLDLCHVPGLLQRFLCGRSCRLSASILDTRSRDNVAHRSRVVHGVGFVTAPSLPCRPVVRQAVNGGIRNVRHLLLQLFSQLTLNDWCR
jgi:hypothetical protein